MDEKEFSQLASRLERAGKVLERLPAEVRGKAFEYMHEYVAVSNSGSATGGDCDVPDGSEIDVSRNAFFASFDHVKPADNVKLIAADFYREYGAEAFTAEEVRQAADDVGITVPQRADMTLVQAKSNNKKLFTRAGKGYFKPTVHGEAYLKETYGVRRGTRKRQLESQ